MMYEGSVKMATREVHAGVNSEPRGADGESRGNPDDSPGRKLQTRYSGLLGTGTCGPWTSRILPITYLPTVYAT